MPPRKGKFSSRRDDIELEKVTRTTRSVKSSQNVATKNNYDEKPLIQKKSYAKSNSSQVGKISPSTRNIRPRKAVTKEVLDKKIVSTSTAKNHSRISVEKKEKPSNIGKNEGSDESIEIIGARRKRKVEDREICVEKNTSRTRSCRAKIDIVPSAVPEKKRKISLKKSKENKPADQITSRNRRVNAKRVKTEAVAPRNLPKKKKMNEEKGIKIIPPVTTKKVLTSEAILNLLSDSEEEYCRSAGKKSAISPKKSRQNNKSRSSFFESGHQPLVNASQFETSKNTSQVPIWKKMEQLKKVDEFTGGDVYDPQAYVSDIEPKDKKKKARKRKKDTRAIIVFGDKNARQAIKEAHNLKTPKVTKKNGGKIGGAAIPCAMVMPAVGDVSSDVSSGAHNYFDSFQGSVATIPSIQIEEVEPVAVQLVAVQPESQPQVIQPQHINPSSLKTGCNSLNVVQTTPVIPKNFSKRLKLQKENVSTPKLVEIPKKTETTKEMIKNAFGFDSEDDEDEMSCSDSILSPVKKLPGGNSFFDASKQFDSRMSVASFRDYEPVKSSLWRFEVEQCSKPRADLLRQVQAMEKQKLEQGLAKVKNKKFTKISRTSPRKLPPPITISDMATTTSFANIEDPSSNIENFVHTNTDSKRIQHEATLNLVESKDTAIADAESVNTAVKESQDEVDGLSQPIRTSPRKALSVQNAYDVLKSAQTTQASKPVKLKKFTKKMSRKKILNDSSLMEDPVSEKINKNGQLRKKVLRKKGRTSHTDDKIKDGECISVIVSDKENCKQSNSLEANQTLPVKTYSMNISKRKDVNRTVSCDQSSTLYKKPTKKDKKIQNWANHQTSHFSEIDDFDISFI